MCTCLILLLFGLLQLLLVSCFRPFFCPFGRFPNFSPLSRLSCLLSSSLDLLSTGTQEPESPSPSPPTSLPLLSPSTKHQRQRERQSDTYIEKPLHSSCSHSRFFLYSTLGISDRQILAKNVTSGLTFTFFENISVSFSLFRISFPLIAEISLSCLLR